MSANDGICTNGGGPTMNTDISGIGVRVSFYLQTVFLACWSLRSCVPYETSGALYTLITTNMAMISSALILGLKPDPEINLHDGLIAFYLLFISIITVYFSLPAHKVSSKFLNYLAILQNYTFFALTFTLLIKAETFGSTPICNRNAVIVIFRPFPALPAGRILGFIVATAMVTLYSWITARDHMPVSQKQIPRKVRRKNVPTLMAKLHFPEVGPDLESNSRTLDIQFDDLPPAAIESLNVDWALLVRITAVLILWVIGVVNTELLIKWNHFKPDSDPRSDWQFGQVLPLFLVIIPLVGMVGSFYKHKIRPSEE